MRARFGMMMDATSFDSRKYFTNLHAKFPIALRRPTGPDERIPDVSFLTIVRDFHVVPERALRRDMSPMPSARLW